MPNDKTPSFENWHFTKEAQTMLSVSVAQIQSTLSDSDRDVNELVQSFVNLAETLNNLISHKTDIDHTDLFAVKQQIEHGIVAFQFYDRVSQRLDHVSKSLETMSEMISNEATQHSQSTWEHFKQTHHDKLTMESERDIFKRILAGASVTEALSSATSDKPADDDNIELF